jgi:plastocyanin
MFRRSLFIAAAIAAVALFVVACGGGASSGGGGGGNALSVTVVNTEFKFDPATINAKPGQTINLTVVNKGTIQHTWVLPSQNIKLVIEPGQSTTKTFTAPAAGTYDIVCDEAGHKEAGMVGKLIVAP